MLKRRIALSLLCLMATALCFQSACQEDRQILPNLPAPIGGLSGRWQVSSAPSGEWAGRWRVPYPPGGKAGNGILSLARSAKALDYRGDLPPGFTFSGQIVSDDGRTLSGMMMGNSGVRYSVNISLNPEQTQFRGTLSWMAGAMEFNGVRIQ